MTWHPPWQWRPCWLPAGGVLAFAFDVTNRWFWGLQRWEYLHPTEPGPLDAPE